MGTIRLIPVNGVEDPKFWREFKRRNRRNFTFPGFNAIENCCGVHVVSDFTSKHLIQIVLERFKDDLSLDQKLLKEDALACLLNPTIAFYLDPTNAAEDPSDGVWFSDGSFEYWEDLDEEDLQGGYPTGPGVFQVWLADSQRECWHETLLRAGFTQIAKDVPNFSHYEEITYIHGYIAYHPLSESCRKEL